MPYTQKNNYFASQHLHLHPLTQNVIRIEEHLLRIPETDIVTSSPVAIGSNIHLPHPSESLTAIGSNIHLSHPSESLTVSTIIRSNKLSLLLLLKE